jgi:hypothetical protein
MGYTHYWTIHKHLSEAEQQAIFDDVKKILHTAQEEGISLCWDLDEPDMEPEVTLQSVRFNGPDDEGHETFLLDMTEPNREFCKTARKPYDAAVGAVLLSLMEHAGNKVTVTSDGDEKDWEDVLNLYHAALGRHPPDMSSIHT